MLRLECVEGGETLDRIRKFWQKRESVRCGDVRIQKKSKNEYYGRDRHNSRLKLDTCKALKDSWCLWTIVRGG